MNQMRFIPLAAILVLIVSVIGCDKGLGPSSTSPAAAGMGAFKGTVRFQNWQLADSLYDMRLIAFRVFPPQDVVNEVQQGRAVVYPPLITGGALATRNTDSVQYTLQIQAGTYPYVVIAQQFGPNIFMDWRAVGQYDLDTNLTQPSPVVVTAGDTTRNIDILVDFAHLPPPPFR